MGKTMKYLFSLLLGLSLLASCSHPSSTISAIRSQWQTLKTLWGDDTEGMLASEGFYGPIEDEFIPLEEEDLQTQFAEAIIPQPQEIPGDLDSDIPSLNQFKKAFSDLATVFQNVYFNTDDYVLRTPEFVQIIDRVAAYMKKHPNTHLSVGGHCDERASESYNLALGTRRSNYIRTLLIQRGVSAEHIHSVSYGKEQPVDFGHNASAWARNRRVEFKIYKK